MLNPYAREIIAQIDNPQLAGRAFRRLLLEFTGSLQDCVKREAVESLEMLAPSLASRNVSRASWVAEVCQAMVESGCDSQVLVRPLSRGLKRALAATRPLAAKLEKKLAPKLRDLEDPAMAHRWTQSAIRQLAIKLPASVASLKAVERFCQTAFTVYGQQPAMRPKVWRYLQDYVEPMARWCDSVGDLQTLLNVLEQEPLVVIDVANRRGFIGKLSGAVDNAQFLILLMDTYAQQLVFGKPLVAYDVAQCARGIGPCHVADPVHGAWNVYTYRALNELQKLPDSKDLKANKHWIWNEQSPAQIPRLDGFRVVLIGPPSYPRQWSFQRHFRHLAAGIQVDHELTKLDIQAWLERIVQANDPHFTPPAPTPPAPALPCPDL